MARNKNIYRITPDSFNKVDSHEFIFEMTNSTEEENKLYGHVSVNIFSPNVVESLRKLIDGHFVEKNGVKYVLAYDDFEFDKVVAAWLDNDSVDFK